MSKWKPLLLYHREAEETEGRPICSACAVLYTMRSWPMTRAPRHGWIMDLTSRVMLWSHCQGDSLLLRHHYHWRGMFSNRSIIPGFKPGANQWVSAALKDFPYTVPTGMNEYNQGLSQQPKEKFIQWNFCFETSPIHQEATHLPVLTYPLWTSVLHI